MKIKDCKTFLLTLGYGRSGSSMLGNILNQHPNCLITMESRFLGNYYKDNNKETKLLSQLIKKAYFEYENQSTMLLNNQNDHKNNNLKIKKGNIFIYGDKKSGGNTTIFINDPQFQEKFMNINKNIKIIINLRNPYNIMKSIKKSKYYNRCSSYIKCNENTSDKDIFKDILYYQNYSINFYKKYIKSCLIVYYDDIINKTKDTLNNLFCFLNIDYIDALYTLVNTKKKESNIMPINYINYVKLFIDKENLYYFNRYIKE